MRSLALVLLILPAAAQAGMLQVDVTYTNGQIISGPLTPDLDALPASVLASFTLNSESAGVYGLGDVAESSLVFGDGTWSLGDLESFSVEIVGVGRGRSVTSLTYAYRPKDTPTSLDKLAANFPLTIAGTDRQSGLAYEYLYDASSVALTPVPEPSTLLLANVGAMCTALWRSRRRSV